MMRRIFLVLLIILSLTAGLIGCGHKAPPNPPTSTEEAKV